jgi:hypothetical protein
MKAEELSEWLYKSRLPEDEKFWGGTIYFEHEAQIDLFRNYLNVIESFLASEKQKQVDESEKIKAEITKLHRLKEGLKTDQSIDFRTLYDQEAMIEGSIGSWLSDLEYSEFELDMINGFADVLRKSFFVNLYSFWEAQLFPLCHFLKSYDEKNMPVIGKVDEFGPDEAKPFLKEIKFPLNSVIWNEINNYRRLRNCIVHHDGKLDGVKDEQKLKAFIRAKNSLVSLTGEDVILEERDGVFLQEGNPVNYRKQYIFRQESINLRKGDIILDRRKMLGILREDILFHRGEKFDTQKVYVLPKKEKIIFRNGETVIVPTREPVIYRKGEAVIYRDGEKVIFRKGEKVTLNRRFCEKALETIRKFFDEVLTALTNWDNMRQRTS